MAAPDTLKIAIAQLNPTVGDVPGNLARGRAAREEARALGADLVVFPELYIAGYPPEDLVLRPGFRRACREAVEAFAKDTADGGPAVLVGTVWNEGERPQNTVALLDEGRVIAVRAKVELPNYGVFDEKRVFAPGALPGPIPFRGVRLGAPVCEDIWESQVAECLAETGAEILIAINGSPFSRTKTDIRMNIAAARVVESGLPLIYVNQVGGQDELVFDGGSFGLQGDGALAFQMASFAEEVALTIWERSNGGWRCTCGPMAVAEEGDAADYRACVMGLRDYVRKNRFPSVLLGLSGGIDSALAATVAADALGPEQVHAVMLPYRYTSAESLADAEACAKALGIRYDVVPIGDAVEAELRALQPIFAGRAPDTTEENIQSRTRGTLLMSISNKLGGMLVTTGNKSEMSVGYATLYGDMNGGYNPLKDLYKTEVYRLARLRNGWRPHDALGPAGAVIPESIIEKAPSAELREGQRDQDSLPPYEVLDAILERLVERDMGVRDIVAEGYDEATVRRVEHLLYAAEFKRRQAPPGVKVTARNFGRDRRYPITNAFRDAR
jgi:NAD+ synthase